MRRLLVFLALSLTLVVSARRVGATTIVLPDDEQLIEKSEIVAIGRVLQVGPVDRGRGIWTEVQIAVETLLKGQLDTSTLVVHDVGGAIGDRMTVVFGAPDFAIGERVLVFATATPRGEFQTTDLFVGKFTERHLVDGTRVWDRPASLLGTTILTADFTAMPVQDVTRDGAKFETFISDIVVRPSVDQNPPITGAPRRRAVSAGGGSGSGTARSFATPRTSYWIEHPVFADFPRARTEFTLITEGEINRWFAFDNNVTVPWYAVGTQPGYSGGGVTEFKNGMAAWTSYPSAKILYWYAGTRSNNGGGLSTRNGFNEVFFNDPMGEIAGSWSASTGGVVGQGGFNNAKAGPAWTSPFAADSAHPQRTYTSTTDITEGNLVIQDGVSPGAGIPSATLAEIIGHELGHTLGFGHSTDPSALMYPTVPGLGPTLRADDQNAARWLYPGTAAPPPAPSCVVPAITSQPSTIAISPGGSATLTVGASGTAPLAYQWYIGEANDTSRPISGATGPSITVSPTASTGYWVRVTNACGTASSWKATVVVNAPAPAPAPAPAARVRGDFNQDGRADLVWRNRTTGADYIWYMNGESQIGAAYTVAVSDPNWNIYGAGDFNRDGSADLLWRNTATGQNYVWLMSGTSQIAGANLPSVAGSNWTIIGVADFNADGNDDILWRNLTNGDNYIWYMNATTQTGGQHIDAIVGGGWVAGGVGDFDGDGYGDVLWRNTTTGANYIWFMRSGVRVSNAYAPAVADMTWSVGAIADVDGNGMADIVWRNNSSGVTYVWFMSGATQLRGAYAPSVTDFNWQLRAPH
jgi:hypothetical protein